MKKLLTFLVALTFLTPFSAFAAVALDSTGSSGGPTTAEASSGSFSFTNTAGTLGVCALQGFRNRTVTSITWDSTVMLTANNRAAVGGDAYTEIWYILNPTIGSSTVSWVISGTDGPTIGCMTFSGNDTSSPMGGKNTATGISGTTGGAAVTTTVDNSIVFSSVYTNNATLAVASGSGQTRQWARVDNRFGTEGSAGSTQTTTTAGSYTSSYTSLVADWVISAIEIKPAVATAATSPLYLTFF